MFKNELELSVMYSSEQYLTEIIKMLNLIFRYFDLHVISMGCPNKHIKKLNNFLYYTYNYGTFADPKNPDENEEV